MAKYHALIFDIDGTAIDSPRQKLPSERLLKAVRAAEGKYYICAATGRTWSFGKDILQGMGLVDPCIISGGTQICDPQTGKILWQCNINPEDIQAIKNVLIRHPGYGIVINDFSEDDYFGGGFPPEELDSSQEVYFADYVFVPENIARRIAGELDTITGITYALGTSQKAGLKDLHIMSKTGTKAHSIAKLLSLIKVDPKNTEGFGDAMNDIPLFEAVHKRVAVANGVPEIKHLADEIIPPVSEDGFAQYLERLPR
jgi:HAD superfamily hydrolase (TIGR01484 family)